MASSASTATKHEPTNLKRDAKKKQGRLTAAVQLDRRQVEVAGDFRVPDRQRLVRRLALQPCCRVRTA